MEFSLLVLLAVLIFILWAVHTAEHVSKRVHEWAVVVEGGGT